VDLIPFAIPFFLLAIVLEVIWDIRQKTHYYRLNDAINSLSLGVLSTASKLVLIDVAGRIYSWVQQDLAIVQWPLNGWLSLIVAFVVYDFFYYWFHRISHERKIFWASHVAHHQSEEYNLTTALRQTSTGFIISWVFYIPCFLLGMPAEIFVTVASANLIYQFWVHTRFVTTIGPLEKFLVTPMNHRVHHARNPEYIDKNYGGFFILWDRLFGSYKPEDKILPVDFGITRGLNSWNPLWANLHVYVDMFRDSWLTPRWKDKLTVWLGTTGYVAPGVNKEAVTPGNHYDPESTLALKCYVTVQFIFTLIAATSLTYFPNELGGSGILALFIFVLLSLIILGLLMDGRGLAWEYLRLLSALILVCIIPLPALLQPVTLVGVFASAAMFFYLWRKRLLR
jgi:alkylglycerol monooxygenase